MNKKLKSYSFDGFSGIFFIVVVDETVAFADVVFVNGNFATGDCSIGFEVVKEALGAAFFGKIFDEDIVGVCLHIGIVDVWDDSAFFSFNDWESEFIKNLLIYHGMRSFYLRVPGSVNLMNAKLKYLFGHLRLSLG
jgi:hypothetical protein